MFPTAFINQLSQGIYFCSNIDLGNTQLAFLGNSQTINFTYSNITGGRTKETGPIFDAGYQNLSPAGGGFYFLYPYDISFDSVPEGGDNPVSHFYFVPTVVYYNSGSGLSKFKLTNTNFIYNCRYAGGVLESGVTSAVLDTSRSSRFFNTQNTTVNQAGATIAAGFDTAKNNFINY
jgi:hypothetical protein